MYKIFGLEYICNFTHHSVQCLNLLNLTKTFFELLRLNNGLNHGLNQLDIKDYVLD
jgi:hypothetical protein